MCLSALIKTSAFALLSGLTEVDGRPARGLYAKLAVPAFFHLLDFHSDDGSINAHCYSLKRDIYKYSEVSCECFQGFLSNKEFSY